MSCSVSGGNASDPGPGWVSDTTTSVAARLLNRPLTWALVVLVRPVTTANAATPIAAPSIVSEDRTGRADTLLLASVMMSARPEASVPPVAVTLFQAGTIRSPSGFRRLAPGSANSVQVAAASAGVFPTVQATLAAGRSYSRIADQRSQAVVVLGRGAAEQLGVRDISAQPAVYIDGIPFTVTGILKSVRREASLLQDAIIPEQTALRYWGPPGNGADLIVATRPGSAAVVASQIPAAILPTDPGRLVVVTSSAPFILQTVINNDISRLLLLAGIIALLIGAAAIASITLTSVLERYYEIGVRRALGATRPAIVAQFLTEATILGACGGLAGTCIAVITLVTVSSANGWYPVLNPLTIIPDPLIGAAVGCAAGAYPALRAALLDPVEALRR